MFDTGGELEVIMCDLRSLVYGVLSIEPMTASGVARVIGAPLATVNATLLAMDEMPWLLAEDGGAPDASIYDSEEEFLEIDTGVLSVVPGGKVLAVSIVDRCRRLVLADSQMPLPGCDNGENLAK
jgi:hypothetical protein